MGFHSLSLYYACGAFFLGLSWIPTMTYNVGAVNIIVQARRLSQRWDKTTLLKTSNEPGQGVNGVWLSPTPLSQCLPPSEAGWISKQQRYLETHEIPNFSFGCLPSVRGWERARKKKTWGCTVLNNSTSSPSCFKWVRKGMSAQCGKSGSTISIPVITIQNPPCYIRTEAEEQNKRGLRKSGWGGAKPLFYPSRSCVTLGESEPLCKMLESSLGEEGEPQSHLMAFLWGLNELLQELPRTEKNLRT